MLSSDSINPDDFPHPFDPNMTKIPALGISRLRSRTAVTFFRDQKVDPRYTFVRFRMDIATFFGGEQPSNLLKVLSRQHPFDERADVGPAVWYIHLSSTTAIKGHKRISTCKLGHHQGKELTVTEKLAYNSSDEQGKN